MFKNEELQQLSVVRAQRHGSWCIRSQSVEGKRQGQGLLLRTASLMCSHSLQWNEINSS